MPLVLTEDHVCLNKLADFSCRFVWAWMTLKNPIRAQYFCYSKIANKIMYTNTRIRIHLPCIYLLKVNNGNSRTRHVICTKLTKKDTRTTQHEDIKKHWHSSGVSIINFEKVPHLFLVFHSWIQEMLPAGFTSRS